MPLILLVRHAQSSYGAADYDVLSPAAVHQTRALHTFLPARGINGPGLVVAAGPGRRHLETAEQVCPDVPVAIDDAWDEYSTDEILDRYGDADAPRASLAAGTELSSRDFQGVLDRALERWIEDRSGDWAAFSRTTEAALARVAEQVPSGGLGIVFTSAGRIAALAAGLLGTPSVFVALNRVQVNTGVTKVVVGGRGTSLVSFNDHTHLEIANPSLVTYR